jgi:hypothetical protein
MMYSEEECREIAEIAKARGIIRVDPSKQLRNVDLLDRSAMNRAIDDCIASGEEFSVKHPALVNYPNDAVSQRLSSLRCKGEIKLVSEAEPFGSFDNPRVFKRGHKKRLTLAECGRKGAWASLAAKGKA